jgi:hypothetical protein
MLTNTFSQAFRNHILGFLWSAWGELGVSTWSRSHACWVIDLEPLLLLTAACGRHDPRLVDESLDWCCQFGQLVSAVRIRTFLKKGKLNGLHDAERAFQRFAATVNKHSTQRWHAAGAEPLANRPSGKSRLPGLERSSLLQLRLRALLGGSARAEALRIFLSHPGAELTAADLVHLELGSSKSAARVALEDLELAGVLVSQPVRNEKAFRLARYSPIRMEGIEGVCAVRWADLAGTLLQLARMIEQAEGKPELVASLELRDDLERLRPRLRRTELPEPPTNLRDAFRPAFEAWALNIADGLAKGVLPRNLDPAGSSPRP